jgi:SAM-dependent methyltransferase
VCADSSDLVASTAAAWNRAARKYAAEVETDVQFLRDGGVSLNAHELRMLGDLSGCARAVHLMCSHGLDTLSLLNLGVAEVVGVDFSDAMLAIAKEKSDRMGARAEWLRCEVLDVPRALDATADLVYTGKGAVPWVQDLDEWSAVIARLLRPGGRFVLHEGHPLNWVWDPQSASHRLAATDRGYFDAEPRANETFPASAVERFTPDDDAPPRAWERQWTIGHVITSLAQAGLRVVVVEEHPEQYWPEFRAMSHEEEQRLPHTYSVVAYAA